MTEQEIKDFFRKFYPNDFIVNRTNIKIIGEFFRENTFINFLINSISLYPDVGEEANCRCSTRFSYSTALVPPVHDCNELYYTQVDKNTLMTLADHIIRQREKYKEKFKKLKLLNKLNAIQEDFH